jgi:ribosomal protein S18 acetylase RimI-like enzyme
MKKPKSLKPIKIRKMLIKDLPQVLNIKQSITKFEKTKVKITVLKEHIRKEGTICLVALADGEVIGYVISEIMTNSFGLDQGGWIEDFGVHSKHMGEGLGQALFTALFELFRKRQIFEIYTAALWDSVDIMSFFKSIGFDRSNFINLYKKL